MKIIEFIGTPGSGKTTLVPAVVETLQELGLGAYTVIEAARPFAKRTLAGKIICRLTPSSFHRPLLWQVFYHLSTLYRLKFFIGHPRLIRQVLASQRRRPIPAAARRYALYWFFHLVGYYEFLKAHARLDEVLIFDEGFIHRVVQLFASEVEEPDPTQVRAYIDLLPQPDLVIAPQAPLEVCIDRIYQRGLWERFSQKSPAEVSLFMKNCFLVVNLALVHIRSEGWNVIEIDSGNLDPGKSKAELRAKLSSLPGIAHPQSQFHPTMEY